MPKKLQILCLCTPNLKELKKEIVKLTSCRKPKYENRTSDVLHIWDNIEGFKVLLEKER